MTGLLAWPLVTFILNAAEQSGVVLVWNSNSVKFRPGFPAFLNADNYPKTVTIKRRPPPMPSNLLAVLEIFVEMATGRPAAHEPAQACLG